MNISDEFILNCNDEIHYERDWIGSLDIEDDTVDDDLAINVLFLCFFPSKPNLLDLIYHFTKSIVSFETTLHLCYYLSRVSISYDNFLASQFPSRYNQRYLCSNLSLIH